MAPIALAYQAMIHEEDDDHFLFVDDDKRKDAINFDRTIWALQRIAESSDLSVFEADSESMSIALSNPALRTIDEESTLEDDDDNDDDPRANAVEDTVKIIAMLYQHPCLTGLRPALQNAIRYHAPLEILKYIVKQDPTALESVDEFGNNMLHLCLLYRAESACTTFLLDEMDPSYVECRNSDNEFPLQLAVSRDFRATCSIWNAMLQRNPEAVMAPQDESLQTVVHTVCSRYKLYPKQFLLSLIDHCPPEAWRQKDRMTGMTPLHYMVTASGKKPVLRAVRHVAEVAPEALTEKDLEDRTPLTMAFDHLGTLRVFLSVAPTLVTQRDPQTRQTLLHQACYLGASKKIIKFLIEKNPRALRMRDNQQLTPLHVAIQCKAAKSVLDELYEENPTALELCDRKGKPLLDSTYDGVISALKKRYKRKKR